jgi:hypothetical protein
MKNTPYPHADLRGLALQQRGLCEQTPVTTAINAESFLNQPVWQR